MTSLLFALVIFALVIIAAAGYVVVAYRSLNASKSASPLR